MRRLTGKDLEILCIEQAATDDRGMIVRYGVSSVQVKGEIIQYQSLPDFDGTLSNGRAFVFDCKVCSQSRFPLNDYREKASKRRQIKCMYDKHDYGAIAGLLIHWNERALKTKYDPFETWWFPVGRRFDFWERFDAGELHAIRREDCEEFGVPVKWVTSGSRGRKLRPDFITAVCRLLT